MLQFKSKERRLRREKSWIIEKLDVFVKQYIESISDVMNEILASKTPILEFMNNYKLFLFQIGDFESNWISWIQNLKIDPKKHISPDKNLFRKRINYILIAIFLEHIAKMPKHRVALYFKEGFVEEDIMETINIIVCEELARKEYLTIESTKKQKRISFSMILNEISLGVSFLINRLLFWKK